MPLFAIFPLAYPLLSKSLTKAPHRSLTRSTINFFMQLGCKEKGPVIHVIAVSKMLYMHPIVGLIECPYYGVRYPNGKEVKEQLCFFILTY
jgi:hypothetical protein